MQTFIIVIITDRFYITPFSVLEQITAVMSLWFWMSDCILFIARFVLNIQRRGVLTDLFGFDTWLVPRENAAISAHVLCTPHGHLPVWSATSFDDAYVGCMLFSCNLPPAEWPGSFTCCCGSMWDGTDTEIRVSTESWKSSRRSCGDSNPRPFDHESGALTTDLSPLPGEYYQTCGSV